MGTALCRPQFQVLSSQLKAADADAAAAAAAKHTRGRAGAETDDDLTEQMARARALPGYAPMHDCVERAMVQGVGHMIPTEGKGFFLNPYFF